MWIKCVSVVVFLWAHLAHADPAYAPKVIPMCKVMFLADGTQGCVYTSLDDVKLMLRLDNELVTLRSQTATQLHLIDEYKLQIVDHVKKENDLTVIRTNLEQELNRIRTARMTCDQDLQNERAKPALGNPLAWAVAIAAAGIALGIGIAFVLK